MSGTPWVHPGGHGNAIFVLAGEKTNFLLIICKFAYKSLLVNVLMLSGASKVIFFSKIYHLQSSNAAWVGKVLGAKIQISGDSVNHLAITTSLAAFKQRYG